MTTNDPLSIRTYPMPRDDASPEVRAMAEEFRARRIATLMERRASDDARYAQRRAEMIREHAERLRRLDDAERERRIRFAADAQYYGLEIVGALGPQAAASIRAAADPEANTAFDAWEADAFEAHARRERTRPAITQAAPQPRRAAVRGLRQTFTKTVLTRAWARRAGAGILVAFSLGVGYRMINAAHTQTPSVTAFESPAYKRLSNMPFPK